MTPIQKAFIAVLTLPIAAVSLFPMPALAQFSIGGVGIGIGIGGGRWHRHRRGGVFFGISPTIVIPSSRRPAYVPPPPTCPTLSTTEGEIGENGVGEPPILRQTQPVFVTGHWEYLPDGRERWVPDRYECR